MILLCSLSYNTLSFFVSPSVVYNNVLTDAFFDTVFRLMSRPPNKTLLVALEKRWDAFLRVSLLLKSAITILYCYCTLLLLRNIFHLILILRNIFHYASPISGEAYRDRRLTTNFELWVEIFCVSTCFHMRIPKPCLSVRPSVCPHPEKGNPLSFVNISPTIVIDASMERFSRVLHNGNPKIWIFFPKKFKILNLTLGEELKSP